MSSAYFRAPERFCHNSYMITEEILRHREKFLSLPTVKTLYHKLLSYSTNACHDQPFYQT